MLVGNIDEGGELVALLRELLGQRDVACEVSNAKSFDPDELFAEERAGVAVRVFIRLADAHEARLYFRGPGGEKFLLRTIALPGGLDEVGRELVGQVVESSVVTLLRSPTGLSRQQASDEVARETSPPKAPAPHEPPAPPREPGEPRKQSAPHERASRSFVLSAALRYAMETFGPDFGLAHGPGLELGIGTRGALRWRGRVSGEWFFEQSLHASELDARVRSTPLRAGVDAAFRLGGMHSVVVGFGGGVDIVRLKPGAARAEGVIPGEPQSDVVPILRPELRYELETRSIVLGAAAFVDIPLVDTHYDLLEDGRGVTVGDPWAARPGGALVFGMVF